MIITRTPFRLSFFGGGTDYPAFFKENGGLVIGTSINKYCYISCRWLPPFFDHRTRAVYSKIEMVKDNSEIIHPGIRGCLEFTGIKDGVEIHHDGDLPARSGLGSSSSFAVGMLLALHGLQHKMPTKKQLADEAIHVEQFILKEHVGIQDQILAAHGGFQVIEIAKDFGYSVSPIILSSDFKAALEQSILLGFTGITRIASGVAKEQVEKMERKDTTASEILGIAQEALTVFRNGSTISEIGKLLHESWLRKRQLGKGVSNDAIDQVYETAMRNGAYGGKVMGAGGGGFMMFLAPPEAHKRIKAALSNIKVWVPFRFDNSGAQVTFHSDADLPPELA